MHDVILIGGEDQKDEERISNIAEAVEKLDRVVEPGTNLNVTFTKKARYQMAAAPTLSDDLDDWLQTASVHVVVSVYFLSVLPQYHLTPVAKDAFWVVVGQLANVNNRGQFIHMAGPGEIPITQAEIAKGCKVSRQTASGGMAQLMERSFLWKAGRGKYQIHPHLLYFGSAEKQSEAIGYARSKRPDGELPPIPRPEAEVVVISNKGVRKFIA